MLKLLAALGAASIAFPALALDAQADAAAYEAAHARKLAVEARRHTDGRQWTDANGDVHADAAHAAIMVEAVRVGLENRYRRRVRVTSAWATKDENGKLKVCGSFEPSDHVSRHYMGEPVSDTLISVGQIDDGAFRFYTCGRPHVLIFAGAERPAQDGQP